ncbi:MAG: DUF285 domain-containing protein, partial [Candidatus Lokiarchaeota archaeon]|nr:DUF285 domain-containing protein [Candidatus Lokiarchaeota archaeon]
IYNSPHSILFNEGLNTIYAYANDSAGNIGITSVTFTIYIIDHNLTFISVWNTTLMSTSSSSSNQVKLPLESSGNYDFLVDWGDGNNNTITSWNQLEVTHTYASEGVYTIRIDGTLIGWRFNDGGDKLKLLEIQQWGILRLGNSMCYFTGCTNLNLTTNDSLNLKGTTSLGLAFTNCTNIGSTGNLNSWDVSKVIDMYAMFWGATSFNQNIHNWSVSNVQDMGGMFAGASSFNQPIDNWNVSSVIYMGGMFQNANSFNQDIHNWSVSNVQYMSDMLQNANSFNQIIGDWNVSRVIYMDYMFAGASSFNQSIGNWDVSSVIRMDGMFSYATSFDQYIGDWNVSRVTNMYYMFSFASSFNQDISNWNISLVTDMGCMFQFATSFNQSIGNWDVSSVTDMSYMFSNAHSFDQDISNWNVCLVANMASMLTYTALSTTNYDKLLIGWWSLPSLQSGVTLDVGTKKYSASAATARLNIINTYGWTINDGGQI